MMEQEMWAVIANYGEDDALPFCAHTEKKKAYAWATYCNENCEFGNTYTVKPCTVTIKEQGRETTNKEVSE